MATVTTTGKSITLPTGGTTYTMSVQSPALFANLVLPLNTNSNKAIVNLTIKSTEVYGIQLKDYTTGNLTDTDTISVTGTLAVFSISGVSVIDFNLIPTINNQVFYIYLSGEIS